MPKTKDRQLLDNIHFIRLVGEKIPDFTVDPDKVHQVRKDVVTTPDNTPVQPTFRYIIALQGKGRSHAQHDLIADIGHGHEKVVNDAKSRLIERIRRFPSGDGNGIIASGASYHAAASLLLDLEKHPIPGQTKKGYSKREQKRVDDLAAAIKDDKGHHSKIVIVRGSFESGHAFMDALNKALEHPHIDPTPHTLPFFTKHDGLSAASTVLTGTGKQIHRVLPNIPLAHTLTGAMVRAGQHLGSLADDAAVQHLHPEHTQFRSR